MKYANYCFALSIVFYCVGAHAVTLTKQQLIEAAYQYGEWTENFGRCAEIYLKNDSTVNLVSAEEDMDWMLDKMISPVLKQGVIDQIITSEDYEKGINAGIAAAKANQMKVESASGFSAVSDICRDDIKKISEYREGFK